MSLVAAEPPVIRALILERQELTGYQRLSLERDRHGTRLVVEGTAYAYRLPLTAFVLESLREAVAAPSAAELATGTVVLGTLGQSLRARHHAARSLAA